MSYRTDTRLPAAARVLTLVAAALAERANTLLTIAPPCRKHA